LRYNIFLNYFSEAENYYEEKNYLKAIEKYSEVIVLNKKNAKFFFKRSECYAKLSIWIESFEDAKISFEINKNMIESFEQAATALKNLNNIDQAIDILKHGISVDKNPNPFENKKNLKMFALLEEFENEILKNISINIKNIINNEKNEKENVNNNNDELLNENNSLKTENNNLKNENKKKRK
jgi:tetratricopeptide (TPR) repeat protein